MEKEKLLVGWLIYLFIYRGETSALRDFSRIYPKPERETKLKLTEYCVQ